MPEGYEHLIRKDTYQVILLSSPLPVPFHFAVHTWLLSVDHGVIKRWEVWQSKNCCKTSWGHVHVDLLPPWSGMRKNYISGDVRHRSTLHGIIEGERSSPAAAIIDFLENKIRYYPFRDRYFYIPGPNSNSFIQWVINHFPEAGFKLPPKAVGKSFKIEMLPVSRP